MYIQCDELVKKLQRAIHNLNSMRHIAPTDYDNWEIAIELIQEVSKSIDEAET